MDKTTIRKDLQLKMDNSLKILDNELHGLRTGRSSVSLLEPVAVEVYGDRLPLSQVASVSTPDSRTITVQVWDKSIIKDVEKAITIANLGLTPVADGQLIRVTIPIPTEQRRKELVKIAHKYGENTKIALRNVRREGNEELKKLEKDNSITKDEHHHLQEEIQKLTDEYSTRVDARIKQKEQDILL